jgi:hypothetical protein
MLDNQYLRSNGRYGVDVTRVNIDDMLVSRPGGIVRVDGAPGDAIFPMTHPTGAQDTLESIQWAQTWLQMSTGVSPDQSSLSADALNNIAPGTVAQSIAAGQTRVEAIARSFASGTKDLFSIVHALTLKNSTHEEKLKLNGNWVTVDPREWVKRTGMTITVGLGTGTRESRLAFLQGFAQQQAQGIQLGIATPENVYETATEILNEAGYRDTQRFLTDPSKNPPQPPQPSPQEKVAQINAQGDQQKLQMSSQIEQQRLQMEDQSKQRELAAQQAVQQSNDQRDALRTQQEFALKREELLMQSQLKREEMQANIQAEIQKANISATAMVEAARLKAAQPDVSGVEKAEAKDAGYGDISTLIKTLIDVHSAPKQIIRDQNGRAVGVAPAKPTVQ